MKFKDLKPGELFYFPENNRYYIKARHTECYIAFWEEGDSGYGGILLRSLSKGFVTYGQLNVFEFNRKDDVLNVTSAIT
jgi:hypothetical protein